MSIIQKEKFDIIIESLISKQITSDQLLKFLNKNRFKLYNDPNSAETGDFLTDISLNSQDQVRLIQFMRIFILFLFITFIF
jgi:hypothetical protein